MWTCTAMIRFRAIRATRHAASAPQLDSISGPIAMNAGMLPPMAPWRPGKDRRRRVPVFRAAGALQGAKLERPLMPQCSPSWVTT